MRQAATSVSITVCRPRERFFYWFVSLDPSRFLQRYGILPAVVGVRDQTGPMYVPGSTRDLVLSDGTTATEEILAASPPESIQYRMTNLTNSFRHLVLEGNASFSFREVTADETQVEWKYSFDAHNWLANLALRPLVATFWTGFMRSALNRVKKLAEEDI